MQLLSFCPSTNECGCFLPIRGFCLEILSITNLEDSRKPLYFPRSPSCSSSGFRSGRSRKVDLKCKFLGCVDLLSNSNKSALASWASEALSVSCDLGEVESEILTNLPHKRDSSQIIPVDFDDENVKKVREEVSENGSFSRIDVRGLGMELQRASTAEEVDQILEGKNNLSLQVYSTIISFLGKEKKLESAMAIFEWLRRKSKGTDGGSLKPNLFVYNSLLGAMKHAQKFDQVNELMIEMEAEGVVPNVVTFNILMGIYIEQVKETKAIDLFYDMQIKGVVPSPASYSTVLFAYRRMEDGFGALSFYVETRNKYQKGELFKLENDAAEWEYELSKLENFTTRICYQVMRRWLVRTENLSTDVIKLLKEMDESGLKPDRENLEKLIWACTRQEHCIIAKELYLRIRELDSEISLSVCNHVIWLLGKSKKWWGALEIYEDLLDKGPKPNNMSYELISSHFNILLTAARKKGIWTWGVSLINKMEEKGLKPGTKEWNSVLIACSKAGETSAAIDIFKRMVENGEKPTIISYGALLSALEKGKLYDEAIKVWKHMTKVGVLSNLYAYTIMASIYTSLGKFDIVDSIIREMNNVGIRPSVVTFNAIISSCGRNNLGSEAYEWFRRMKVENVVPNEVTYEVLIDALAKDGKPRLAYELYVRALNEGFMLSSKAYDAVVLSSETYGATISIDALGPKPLERKKTV